MSSRDRVAEIAEKKRRGPKHVSRFESEFQRLQELWQKTAPATSETDDFFVIRAVTLLEAFSREYLARLIDSGSRYAERVVDLKLELKFDLRLVRAIERRVITLGDLIADAVPISSFAHMDSVFSRMIGEDLVALIAKAKAKRVPWMPDYKAGTIITDPEGMAKALVRLFEVRHILCHEFPQQQIYAREEIGTYLEAMGQFAAATIVTLDQLIYGDVPDTMEGQIAIARHELDEEEMLMAEVYARVEGDADRKKTRLLTKAQSAWEAFKQAQCAYAADRARGGTASRLLWVAEADVLTRQRTDSLRRSLSNEE
jgi:uncharacterized protein YecT (DUF1311 family)